MQTLHGKTIDGVARIARRYDVPVIAFAGTLDGDVEETLHARSVVCVPILDGPLDLPSALARTSELLERAAARVARTFDAARRDLPG